MRDRRNTNLSISSASSSTSTPTVSTRTSLNEKRHSSPPPPSSPTLPPPVTKGTKFKANSRRPLVLKGLAVVSVFLLLLRWFYSVAVTEVGFTSSVDDLVSSPSRPIGEGDYSPDRPTALVISDRSGRPKWTVAIPPNSSFPLRASQYQDICTQSQRIQDDLSHHSVTLGKWSRKGVYYSHDRTFLDVGDAEKNGALSPPPTVVDDNVCATSLTFAMDTEGASFGKTLLMLWLSYGLARKEGRAFFLDDTRWPYGKYTSYFTPPPSPTCSPPPTHHIVPCPHQARHLLVSAATAPRTFGPAFDQAFTRMRKHGVERHRHIYDLIRTGYEDLFHLIGDDAAYAEARVSQIREDAATATVPNATVGIHIRRGDLHPHEYQFSHDYLPLERYAVAARILSRSLLNRESGAGAASEISTATAPDAAASTLFLASDDPSIYLSPDLSQAATPFGLAKAQERIQLATKASLDSAAPVHPIHDPGSAYVKHVDENSGWDGGFYSALFTAIGNPAARPSAATGSADQHPPPAPDAPVSDQAMHVRELVGRAYLLDLAVVGASDAVVCAVSSAACRVLGVMLGWDAVRAGRWVNVDDRRPWSWDGRR